ncbi:c-type cytochrome [Bdellovibrio sp. NC01]|uniref:c-type cytochrome n=1 Tax=Bdellovibrio sp. NC01 TaxID=2220073 RepID=UPI00115BA4C7|nr:c-type cytochrome [Bdellovibrio sp. NC01]QDK36349.1 cytochrome c4 [Bdellovibrio sp. NC01]
MKLIIKSLIMILFAAGAYAADEPDMKAGEDIAMKGTPEGATACFACHGTRTEENKTGSFPRMVNQSQYYILQQLKDYSSGARNNAVMGPIAKALTDKEKADVAAYYAKILFPTPKVKKAASAVLKRGEELAVVGDLKIQVQACNNCHGPGGMGMAPAIPAIAGQHANYLEAQLKAWKDGQRKNSADLMGPIAKRLSDKDISALALYFEQVQINAGKAVAK